MNKHTFRTILTASMFVVFTLSTQAQTNENWLENTMLSSGKINVVVTVVSAIFVLLVIYLISIDRRLAKMEKRNTNNLK